ncbi:unnamed protein product [Leuciscus chuanchicus]
MRDKTYKVVVSTGDSADVTSTSCECPRGEYKCSHAAALMIWAVHNLSSTDVECRWKKPRGPSDRVKAVEELFPGCSYKPLTRSVTPDDRKWLLDQFQGRFTGVSWLLTPEPETQQGSLLHLCSHSIVTANKHLGSDAVLAALRLSLDQIMAIQTATVGQKDNHLWHALRKGRLTASNFGSVLSAKRATPSLINRLCGNQDLSGVLAVQWGIVNEKEGIAAFEEGTGLKVRGSGLWLADSGILGATPDGLVGETGIIEVKCPYRWRDSTFEEAVKENSFYLHQEGGTYHLKRDHSYWHQVQGQLHITGKTTCHFIIWTPKQCMILPISRDDSWLPNLGILEAFYRAHMLPHIEQNL